MSDSISPALLVFSTLFPNVRQPNAGVFIRERMFRVAKELPVVVVAPQAWFPFQSVIRLFKPHFRPTVPKYENQDGIDVYHPRFLSVPGVFKSLDGFFLAVSSYWLLRSLKQRQCFNIIDAHFAYPDGYAASLLGRWLKLPFTITLRGTEARLIKLPAMQQRMLQAMKQAARVYSVSASLKQVVVDAGINPDKVMVVGNGVDTSRFKPLDKLEARSQLDIPDDARVLITVGALCERKGFHRVLEVLPEIRQRFQNCHYLIVGGATAEGDWEAKLKQQVAELGLQDVVHFLGSLSPDQLKLPLSAADVFVLSTRNEGWANVILEAMACGLPVIASDVGGNAEVVANDVLGTIVPFDDSEALKNGLLQALMPEWDASSIIAYARDNSWDQRVAVLTAEFTRLLSVGRT